MPHPSLGRFFCSTRARRQIVIALRLSRSRSVAAGELHLFFVTAYRETFIFNVALSVQLKKWHQDLLKVLWCERLECVSCCLQTKAQGEEAPSAQAAGRTRVLLPRACNPPRD